MADFFGNISHHETYNPANLGKLPAMGPEEIGTQRAVDDIIAKSDERVHALLHAIQSSAAKGNHYWLPDEDTGVYRRASAAERTQMRAAERAEQAATIEEADGLYPIEVAAEVAGDMAVAATVDGATIIEFPRRAA